MARREFLGFLGLAMLSPVTPAPRPGQGDGARVPRAYLGPVRDLLAGVPVEPGWALSFDALVESVDVPVADWLLTDAASVRVLPWAPPPAALPGLLRARGVARACEASLDVRGPGGRHAGSYGVDLALFDGVGRCEAAWRAVAAAPAAAGLDPLPGVGDAAVAARGGGGGWSAPGKIYFRRANALAAVVP